MALDPDDTRNFLPAANAVQKLLSEAEMGELFKVIALTRDFDAALPLAGFARGDRSHAL
jgi:SAM-dependent MidA family methyltransferase